MMPMFLMCGDTSEDVGVIGCRLVFVTEEQSSSFQRRLPRAMAHGWAWRHTRGLGMSAYCLSLSVCLPYSLSVCQHACSNVRLLVSACMCLCLPVLLFASSFCCRPVFLSAYMSSCQLVCVPSSDCMVASLWLCWFRMVHWNWCYINAL